MVARSALFTVLIVAASATGVVAQEFCYPIRAGDTAGQLAERLTGTSVNRRAPWFQILDEHWRPVPKIHYGRIQPGWLACLVGRGSSTTPAPSFVAPVAAAGLERRPQAAAGNGSLIDVALLLIGAVILGALLGSRYAVKYWVRTQERARHMRQFGAEFVREFGRPLAQYRDAGPLPRARLRVSPHRSRLDILVAPPDGRSYPNLSDHRSNVEYDIARVLAALGRASFVNGRPYEEGRWVVVPFQYNAPLEQEALR